MICNPFLGAPTAGKIHSTAICQSRSAPAEWGALAKTPCLPHTTSAHTFGLADSVQNLRPCWNLEDGHRTARASNPYEHMNGRGLAQRPQLPAGSKPGSPGGHSPRCSPDCRGCSMQTRRGRTPLSCLTPSAPGVLAPGSSAHSRGAPAPRADAWQTGTAPGPPLAAQRVGVSRIYLPPKDMLEEP